MEAYWSGREGGEGGVQRRLMPSRYVKSRSDKQIRGAPAATSTGYCDPEEYLNGDTSLPILPCGLAAWSLFNDTYQVPRPFPINQLRIRSMGEREGSLK
jgi:hypothetical protein